MEAPATLLLTRKDVAELMNIQEYIDAVELAFRMYGEGKTAPPGILGVHANDGGFHIKAGILELQRPYFAAKVNANFPHNPQRLRLPTIQGMIALCDAENGCLLALMDSMEITIQRTGAATAVAAKYLARSDSRTVTICGCGNQGRVSLQALSQIFALDQAFAFDIDASQSQKFASNTSLELGITVNSADQLGEAVAASDIVVTCTPSHQFFLNAGVVQPGTFIAAVGADSETKHELDPTLLAKNKLVVDILEQCETIGELHHAIDDGLMSREDVHAELGQVVAGLRTGRESSKEVIVFDSTGMALQDVISAATVYERAMNRGLDRSIKFAD